MIDAIRQAAQAVVERWDTPLWKDVPHTAEYIEALRAALASCPDCGKPAPEGSIHTCSPQKPDSWDAVIDNMMGEQKK